MQHSIEMYLLDINKSIDSIFEYLEEVLDFDDYELNKMVRRAVERELEIIGEALNRIIKIDPLIDISDIRRIINLRNVIIHAYDNVDNVIIWGIINKDLQLLKDQVNVLLSKINLIE
jgi:uncharacterized protein with HEPN domain